MFSITLEKVSKVYENGVKGLDNVTLKVNAGEFVFLVGQTGSGKSTMLQLLTKELEPTMGKILIASEDITNMPQKQIPFFRRKIGIVKERPLLSHDKSVAENIELALLATGQPKAYREQAIHAALGIVGMRNKAALKASVLSGGESSRIALARAIVNNPSLLIADEPTAGLDPDTAWDMIGLLNEINRRGVTVIMATHDKQLVNLMKKRVVTLFEGRLLGDAKNAKYGYLI